MSIPTAFDENYFSSKSWAERLKSWLEQAAGGFASANAKAIERMLANPKTAVRIVINIRPDALTMFLNEGHYRNIYELPVIGFQGPDQNRIDADDKVGIDPNHYFAAAAMGGAGIRYYGEYCIVLKTDFTDHDHDPQIFDRDSYDVLFPPLDQLSAEDINCIKGRWAADIASMLMLRVLPDLHHERQIATSGTVVDLALKDQEFIEVHLARPIRPEDVDQVVESPETAALEVRILEREHSALQNRMHELEWVRRRTEVAWRLEQMGIRYRVVTQTGRGFQWR